MYGSILIQMAQLLTAICLKEVRKTRQEVAQQGQIPQLNSMACLAEKKVLASASHLQLQTL